MVKSIPARLAACAALIFAMLAATATHASPVDIHQLAHHIIVTSLHVQPGEVVVIEGGKHTVPLMEALTIEAQLAGGEVTMFLDSDKAIRSFEMDVPERYLALQYKFFPSWFRQVDVYISLPNASDIAALDAGVSARRLGIIAKSSDFMTPLLDSMKYRVLSITYPTKERGNGFRMDSTSYVNMIWAAMNADYEKIAAQGMAIKSMMKSGSTVHVTSPNGTDVTFKLGSRPVALSVGIMTAEMSKGKHLAERSANLPDGNISVAPIESSANGEVVSTRTPCRFEGLNTAKFKFVNGVMSDFTAGNGLSCYTEGKNASGGPVERFGALSIGLNPAWAVHEENGAIYYPGAAAGAVYLNVGDNQTLGGVNKTVGNYGFGFFITNATVTIDGTKVIDGGKLTL